MAENEAKTPKKEIAVMTGFPIDNLEIKMELTKRETRHF